MTIIHAHFDGKVFVPDEPVDLPPQSSVLVMLKASELPKIAPPKDPERPLADLLERLGGGIIDPSLPKDLAMQHDHYLYGLPKKENP